MSALLATLGITTLSSIALFAEDTEFDEAAVTPGVIGFGVTALFALVVIFLGWDLVRRVRRAQNRAMIDEELAGEIAERDAAENATEPPTGQSTDSPTEK